MKFKILLPVVLLVAVARCAFPQGSGNLVQNGDFETGSFTGWTLMGDPEDTFVSLGFSHGGNYAAVFGALDAPDYISQTLPTSPGQEYLLSFWFASGDNGGGTPNAFTVQWGGNAIVDVSNIVRPSWTNLQFTVTALSDATVLAFGAWNNQDYSLLDDISVTVPGGVEPPAFLDIAKTNSLVTLVWSTVAGRVYQPQYKTNLAQTAWSDLGATIAATNATLTVSDAPGQDPQRFYRVVLLP